MWIVMTSGAHMPSSCKGHYRNVALVKIDPEYTAMGYMPRMISDRAKGVQRVIHMGHHNVGSTDRCSYARTKAEAERRAFELNNAAPDATDELLMSWGGSA